MDNTISDAISKIQEFSDNYYKSMFAPYFRETRDLFNRLKSKVRPITDDELSWILISLPLTLFDVSGKVSEIRTAAEVGKLRIKQLEHEFCKESDAKTASAKKEEASISTIDDKMLLAAYQGLIDRVENEMSFSRELIMGAKKIWDARRRTEQSNPIAPVDTTKKTPIYGSDMP